MKKKILFFGWEPFMLEVLKTNKWLKIGQDYEIIVSEHSTDALCMIAEAALVEKEPICAIVIKRNELISNHYACKEIVSFAEHYPKRKMLVAINMIADDQDIEAKTNASSAFYAKTDDWTQVKVILDNNT